MSANESMARAIRDARTGRTIGTIPAGYVVANHCLPCPRCGGREAYRGACLTCGREA